jgi:hypothetical protein
MLTVALVFQIHHESIAGLKHTAIDDSVVKTLSKIMRAESDMAS